MHDLSVYVKEGLSFGIRLFLLNSRSFLFMFLIGFTLFIVWFLFSIFRLLHIFNLVTSAANSKLCPVGVYLLKANNRNTRTKCEICSVLTIKTPERRQWRRCGIFIVNFEHISHLVLVFLLLTLNMLMPTGGWVRFKLDLFIFHLTKLLDSSGWKVLARVTVNVCVFQGSILGLTRPATHKWSTWWCYM